MTKPWIINAFTAAFVRESAFKLILLMIFKVLLRFRAVELGFGLIDGITGISTMGNTKVTADQSLLKKRKTELK